MKKSTKMTFTLSVMLVLGLIGFGTSTASASDSIDENEFGHVDKQFSISNSSNISIELSVADADIGISPDDTVHITYYNTEDFKYEIEQSDDELVLKQIKRAWGVFNISDNQKVTVLIPKQFKGELSIDTSTGNISIHNVSASSIDLHVTTGDINAEHISSTGDITLRSTTGGVDTVDVYSSGNIIQRTTTGSINAEGLISDSVSLKCSTGNIAFSELDAQNITIDMGTGNVRGSIVGNESDFTVKSSGFMNNNNLPENWGSGSKMLDVSTSVGSIDVSFAE